MDINKKSRADLKKFFVKNAVPTEGNFADLIDAMVNQKDDGLTKSSGEPLSVEAAGTTKAAIRLYDSFGDASPAWTLGVQDNTGTAPTKGFALTDGSGATRLFVSAATGALTTGALTASGAVNTGVLTASGIVNANLGLTVTGGALNVGTGTSNAQRLTVWGQLTANGGLSIPSGQTLAVAGPLTASAGLAVTGGALTVGAPGMTQPLTVHGALTANGGLLVGLNQSIAVDTLTSATVTVNNTGTINIAAGRTLATNVLNASGLVSANLGLTVTGAGLNVGTSASNAQPLTVWGPLNVNGPLNLALDQPLAVGNLLTANGGLRVGASQSLAADTLTSTTVGAGNTGTIRIATGRTLATNALSASGQISANLGLTVSGAGVSVGTSASDAQPLTVWGSLNANGPLNLASSQPLTVGGLLTANGGLRIGASQSLATDSLTSTTVGAGNTGVIQVASGTTLIVNALLARKEVGLEQGLTVTGGPLLVGTSAATAQGLTVWGPLAANGGLNLGSGIPLTVPGALTANMGLTVTGAPLVVGMSLDNPQRLVVWGPLNANGGLSLGSGQPLTVGGLLTANLGLTVTGGPLNVGTSAANAQSLTVWGPLNANGGFSLGSGQPLTVGGLLTASQGLTVTGGPLSVGTSTNAQTLTVSGGINANGGLTVPDSRDLTVVGSLTSTGLVSMTPPGRSGLRLDKNQQQHVTLPTIPGSLQLGSGFMVQAWIYPNSFYVNANDPLPPIFDFGADAFGFADRIALLINQSGILSAHIVKGTVNNSFNAGSSSGLRLGAWNHVALTVDNTGVLRIYINGTVSTITTASSANLPNNVDRTINWIGRAGNDYFNGLIAEVSLWTGNRTPVMGILNGTEDGLVGYWKLNDGPRQPTTLTDSCSKSNRIGAGTPQNNPIITLAPNRGQQVNIVQEDWTAPDLLTGPSSSVWVPVGTNVNPPGFFKDSSGIVRLRGQLKTNTGTFTFNVSTTSVLFRLPPGYRPQFIESFIVISANSLAGVININPTDGSVTIAGGNSSVVSLDGVSFRAFQ